MSSTKRDECQDCHKAIAPPEDDPRCEECYLKHMYAKAVCTWCDSKEDVVPLCTNILFTGREGACKKCIRLRKAAGHACDVADCDLAATEHMLFDAAEIDVIVWLCHKHANPE